WVLWLSLWTLGSVLGGLLTHSAPLSVARQGVANMRRCAYAIGAYPVSATHNTGEAQNSGPQHTGAVSPRARGPPYPRAADHGGSAPLLRPQRPPPPVGRRPRAPPAGPACPAP